jgi:hypothetical protein
MKRSVLKKIAVLAAPIIWRRIRGRRGHHSWRRHRAWHGHLHHFSHRRRGIWL